MTMSMTFFVRNIFPWNIVKDLDFYYYLEKPGLVHLHQGNILYERLYRQNKKRHPRINTSQKYPCTEIQTPWEEM